MKLLSVLLGLVLIADARAEASLLGDTVDAGMYRTIDTGKGVGRITGFGLDSPFVVENGLADQKNYSVAYTLNVDADRFVMDYRNPFAWGAGIVFRLTDLDFSNGASLQSLMVDTNMVGYGLTVGADYVEINLSGVSGTRDAYFSGQFITTAVPEPTSIAMLSLGLAVVGFGAHRARKARQA
ncbi:PEP-CTERM sorting domain-containing protein [Massilia scottii]|uniref:PEP-CTERM sorting domain-containing protein n=1 Tax=Massilia scottii TaxID=3057166 RepID=UPI0027965E51|nr:PEP-CTERM sorting domain-containing protein [Massilia sp. CCM 9029]MDQ1832549.1 PEP-CTERM sorting domain-containing protein [Massilia sp. CCM 9029]